MSDTILEMQEKMATSLDAYHRDLSKIRTGRASLTLLDSIRVEAYGSPMPLNQLANLTVPENRLIVIQPWDLQLINAIEKAILKSNIGLNPNSDGKVIRISFPQLTEERRKELVKQVKKITEDYRVTMRNHRRDTIDLLKNMKKDKEITEDDLFRLQDEAQKETDLYIRKVDEYMTEKEKEVMEV